MVRKLLVFWSKPLLSLLDPSLCLKLLLQQIRTGCFAACGLQAKCRTQENLSGIGNVRCCTSQPKTRMRGLNILIWILPIRSKPNLKYPITENQPSGTLIEARTENLYSRWARLIFPGILLCFLHIAGVIVCFFAYRRHSGVFYCKVFAFSCVLSSVCIQLPTIHPCPNHVNVPQSIHVPTMLTSTQSPSVATEHPCPSHVNPEPL